MERRAGPLPCRRMNDMAIKPCPLMTVLTAQRRRSHTHLGVHNPSKPRGFAVGQSIVVPVTALTALTVNFSFLGEMK